MFGSEGAHRRERGGAWSAAEPVRGASDVLGAARELSRQSETLSTVVRELTG